jgi:hypothetical protein
MHAALIEPGTSGVWRKSWRPDESERMALYVDSTGADGVYEVIEEVRPSKSRVARGSSDSRITLRA